MTINTIEIELFIKNMEIRNKIIDSIEKQLSIVKQICIGIVTVILGYSITTKQGVLLYILTIIPILFLILEASIKKHQRGYIYIANIIQKEMTHALSEEDILKIINKYFYDLNGHDTFRNNKDKKVREDYKQKTSFWKTLTLSNVLIFYIFLISLQLMVVILIQLKLV